MLPSVVASEVQRGLLDYLRTTFRLRDKALEHALFRYLSDEKTGMFQGPYLDVRLPFRKALDDWEATSPLDYGPSFVPYMHQLRSFERLSARHERPQNTLVTTGTGSGKTECFLYPILDHCRRARLRGQKGIKAIILYPMNALASDQAERLAGMLQSRELENVSAGLYVGGKGQHGSGGPKHLVDDRLVLRKSPPDILLTNYRMLDFLLMRPEDSELWEDNTPSTLQYLVLDELHTYDGAQGSDVACLIRRLKARLGMQQGQLCCVGTSATIDSGASGGGHDASQLLASFAQKIFAEPFDAECLIKEDRLTPSEAFVEVNTNGRDPLPLADEEWAKLQPAQFSSVEEFIKAQKALWFERSPATPGVLGFDLGSHPFTGKLLRGIAGKERRSGARHWREVALQIAEEDEDFAELSAERQWLLLSSFISLVAYARSEVGASHFLQVQVQLWIRELHGLLRCLSGDTYRFAWQDELKKAPGESWLPMVFCRECGFDGFAALKREGDDFLRDSTGDIGDAFLHRTNRARVVELLDPLSPPPAVDATGQQPLLQNHLCLRCLRVGVDRECQCGVAPDEERHPVRIHPEVGEGGKPLPLERCPACLADEGIGFLASRAATLSSVSVSELFVSDFNDDPKLLAFTDSVQDASHRAGFFAARTFRFSMRTAIQALLEVSHGAVPLMEFTPRLIEHWTLEKGEAGAAALLVPPDLNEDQAYLDYFGVEQAPGRRHGPSKAQRAAMRELLDTRVSWEVTREYGLAVPLGRSLDATGCSTLAIDEEKLAAAAQELLQHLTEHHRGSFRSPPELPRVQHFLDGLVQRLRLGGGIWHPLLERFAERDDRFLLYKSKNPRLSRFGPRSTVPHFWYQGDGLQRSTYQPLHSSGKVRSWYRVWSARALGLFQENDASLNDLLDRAVRALRDHGIVDAVTGPHGRAVYGLAPAAALLSKDVTPVVCQTCGHRLTLVDAVARRFVGRPCMRFACDVGTYVVNTSSEAAEQYYQRLYKGGRVERIFAGEHTGLLDRPVREALERSFKDGSQPNAPNLLTCTPTLEMGIDIGDLSNVMLCAVPPLPANYVQRVGRAGRKTGNAMVLTVANRRPHDRYFFDDPYQMLRGEIAPPGCFLDAPEILRRQVLAFAMDAWARDLGSSKRMSIPAKMQLLRLNAKEGFPGQFWPFYQEHKQALTEQFLELFGEHVSEANRERLRADSSGGGLAAAMKRAFEAVKQQITDYSSRLKEVRARILELEEDPSKASVTIDEDTGVERVDVDTELQELRDSEHAYRRLRAQLSEKYPLEVLASAGVIPNYAFPEPGVTLSALLRSPFEEGDEKKQSQRVEYLRAASQALRDFAPFNTFYAEGHKIKISQLDLGTNASAIEQWRLCASCHYMQRVHDETTPQSKCPRCQDGRWSDTGQKRPLVLFRRALSVMDRVAASTAEDSEDREQESYALLELMDVSDKNWSGARLVRQGGLVFGYELLQRQSLRELNVGRRGDLATAQDFAGQRVPQRGFLVCRDCGRVSESEGRAQHTPTCRVRQRNKKADFERVFLYRQFESEAIRLLLPISHLEDATLLHSMKAALYLGFRKKFLGHPDHLGITTAKEPRGSVVRNFLVIYDGVPGGTGYLAELWKSGGVLEILRLAQRAMQSCSCAEDDTKDGCYRCVFAYQQSFELPHISRSRAVELIEEILAAEAHFEEVTTLSEADVGDLTESELERKFLMALQERASAPGYQWTPTQYAGKPCHVLTTPNSQWRVEPQVQIGQESGVLVASQPDFVLHCLSSTKELPIAVFCDGLAYHVCPDAPQSRLWDDIHKRRALLESGNYRVWSLTWKDLQEGGGVTSLLTRVQRELYQMFFKDEWQAAWKRSQELSGLSSWQLLWEYLEHPEPSVWERAALGFASGMLQVKPPWSTDSIRNQQTALREQVGRVGQLLQVADVSKEQPKRWAGLDARSDAMLLAQIPSSELKRNALESVALTLRLFDEQVSRQQESFEESWRAFLHAWNILQFHPGELDVVSGEYLQMVEADQGPESTEDRPAKVSSRPPPGRSGEMAAPGDAYALFAAEFSEGKHIAELAAALRERDLPLPIDAAEHDIPLQLEAIVLWPSFRIVLVPELSEADVAAWKAEGWLALDYDAPADEIIRALTAEAT